ncbi:protein-L-isoaspartate(D-aspartate) O-methyltransferase [Celerinatantimonas diazotrophica]|uniref:Protein-L-isoaspartate O-methyltransferase n=1 Tax=Celerinatantimonas diazotrophica TaxID=412034 RepID=A0A4R1J9F5_9GAMM|nr:protein-L-isoaspartate(D-aspartate) O-methyltransferase [Celerinatantimonas diazotrophica]TCK47208.1 protein-L-isoaspartate(D-aspartate) O-methyltransferase [Celerinatantimonas diazotrophica]CAG9295980.1 Protein-L-isoaspartate O-methyltransferase [Celerinatantimonas diazotrophica]
MQLGTTPQSLNLCQQLREQGITNEQVLAAIANLPRQYFVDEALSHKAWDNAALPIGQGQTLSQPYTVARMTELLMEVKARRVLEIGTGSGFQTAVLAQLFEQVYSVERIKILQFQAKRRLNNLDLHNIWTKHGDGWQGWPARAPFDAIIVTAAAVELPAQLTEQLCDGGILIIPLGSEQQLLYRIERQGSQLFQQQIESVHFVPLINGELA